MAKDIPNSHFPFSEEERPAIRALRRQIIDACTDAALRGDLCLQALIEALGCAVNEAVAEIDRLALARTIAGVLVQAFEPPAQNPSSVAELTKDIPLPAGSNRDAHDQIVDGILAAIKAAYAPSTTFFPVEAIAAQVSALAPAIPADPACVTDKDIRKFVRKLTKHLADRVLRLRAVLPLDRAGTA